MSTTGPKGFRAVIGSGECVEESGETAGYGHLVKGEVVWVVSDGLAFPSGGTEKLRLRGTRLCEGESV